MRGARTSPFNTSSTCSSTRVKTSPSSGATPTRLSTVPITTATDRRARSSTATGTDAAARMSLLQSIATIITICARRERIIDLRWRLPPASANCQPRSASLHGSSVCFYKRIDDRLRTWNRTDGVGRQHLDQRVEEGRIAAGRGTLRHDEADGVIYVHPLLETEAMRRRIAVVNDRIPDPVPRAFVLPQDEVHAVPAAPVQIVDLAADPDVAREGALPETRNRLIARRRCFGPDLLVRPRSLPMV